MYEGHFCAGSGQNSDNEDEDDDYGQSGKTFAYPDTCRGDSGGPVTVRYQRTPSKASNHAHLRLIKYLVIINFSLINYELEFCHLVPSSKEMVTALK